MSRVFDYINSAYAAAGSGTQKHVLLVIAIAANDAGVCWPSQEAISERTGLSERAVRDAIKHWEDVGVLETRPNYQTHVKYGNRRVENVYTLRTSADAVGRSGTSGGGSNRHQMPVGQPAPPAGANRHQMPVQGTTSEQAPREQRKPSAFRTRRAAAAEEAAVGDPVASVWEKPPAEEDQPKPRSQRQRNPDSAGGLAQYWAQEVLVKMARVGGRREDIVRRFMAEWLRRGVDPAVLHKMVDIYTADPSLREAEVPWKVFVSKAEMLQRKAENVLGYDGALTAAPTTWENLPASLLASLAELEEVSA